MKINFVHLIYSGKYTRWIVEGTFGKGEKKVNEDLGYSECKRGQDLALTNDDSVPRP